MSILEVSPVTVLEVEVEVGLATNNEEEEDNAGDEAEGCSPPLTEGLSERCCAA